MTLLTNGIKMINNYCDLYKLSLDHRRYYTEAQHEILSLGLCLEPFYSKINHSCEPNAYWCFNGRELQVRAEHDIQAGTELSISYITGGDYKERKEKLSKWGFSCVCRLCRKGDIGPRGSVRTTLDEIFNTANVEGIPAREKLDLAEKGISELKRAGWAFDASEMRKFYDLAYEAHHSEKNKTKMLKTWLRIYYHVEPYQQSLSIHSDRIPSL